MAQLITYLGGSILALLITAQTTLAQDKNDKTADDKPAAEKIVDEKSATDTYNVPEGTTKELKEYIQKIIRNIPSDEATYKKARAAMLKAAEKMIAGGAKDDELDFAVDVKIRSLDKPEDITAFGEELKKAGHEKQSRNVQNYELQNALRNSILSGKIDLQRKQIAEVIKYLQEAPPRQTDLNLAIMTGQIAEFQGDVDYAKDVYRDLGKVFSGNKDERLAEFGKRLEGVVRRLSLLGNKIKLEGKLLSGEDFDYSKYKGKVVLVDFWATWRQPCITDLPKLKKIYEQYRDKGLEIIGFAGDYRREEVEKFVKEREISWATVYGDKGPSPTIEYYGILTIPTMILVGKDGNVKVLDVNIDNLPKELDKLLRPAEEKTN